LKPNAPATFDVTLTGKSRSLGSPINTTVTINTKDIVPGRTIPALAAKALIEYAHSLPLPESSA